jgi:hypothetical protein
MNKQKIILKWLNKEFNDLTIVVKIHKTHYVNEDGEILFYYKNNIHDRLVYINYNKIWLLLKNIFIMTDNEIRKLLEVWINETYGLTKRIPTMSVLIGVDDTL